MFDKILIANRGEIACRVIRTAKRLGVGTVAVYSEADARAKHVGMADEAILIGPPPARESYLSIERIVDAAKRSGAEAIHPGYGFLSENANFAEACLRAGSAFIGPPASAIRAMGSKAAAKALMEASGVQLVPGYHGDAQDEATLQAAAEVVGYPVLIKSSAGGGGRGMRIVEKPRELAAAIESAKREALSSFGDSRLLIEKYLMRPRHIEVQIFADSHGNAVSLFERDCSIQRRHQKVIEEAPAPGMDPQRRAAMGEAAVKAAGAVGYVGAGTVEFIAQDGEFFFMEMNTRLQVEHPVTEMITGLDLVEWQLRVACGEPLPLRQDQLEIRGCAIEARICAEDPSRDFLPSTGALAHLREPPESPSIRVDSGVLERDEVTPNYDSMLAKLIVWGENRDQAVRRLARALAQYEVVGVHTNIELLSRIAAHADFARGDLDTGFIARRHDELLQSSASRDEVSIAAVAAAYLDGLAILRRGEADCSRDRWSPWNALDSWRSNDSGSIALDWELGGEHIAIRIESNGSDRFNLRWNDAVHRVAWRRDGRRFHVAIDGQTHSVSVVRIGDDFTIIRNGRNDVFRLFDPLAPPGADAGGTDRVIAPIPARVTRVLVAQGDHVKKGAPLVMLEAMKMELTLNAPYDGIVSAVKAQVGEMITEGAELVIVDSELAT